MNIYIFISTMVITVSTFKVEEEVNSRWLQIN